MREFEDATDYIHRILKDTGDVSRVLRTKNPAVNALLSAKYAMCQKRGIAFDMIVRTPMERLPVEDWQMCRVLSNLIKRCMDDGMPPETTGMQGWIIGFLHRNEDRDMFQRDVEAEFNIRRSTATGILQLMEKNGFLLREPVAYDARLKKLVLTPKALAVHEGVISRIRATEARITKDVTPEELEQFFAITAKFRRNLE
mgnify:CR=1 FL=1